MEAPASGASLMAVFATPDAIVAAARQLRLLGIEAFEAYTPYPVDGLDEVVRRRRRVVLPLTIFAAAVIGALWGYFIQYWDEVIDYPLNVGGRPPDSWPAFIVATFEFTVLFALAGGFFGLFIACRLPRLYHPIFAAPDFGKASVDRYVLCVDARDPGFTADAVRGIFERQGAELVAEVGA